MMDSYTDLANDKIEELVQKNLSPKRYNHVLCVTRLATEMAEHYGVDREEAWLAAMLHDICKELDKSAQLQIIKKSDIILNTVDEKITNLYHAITGYLYAKDTMQISNADILNAIRFHTTGRIGMSVLEKIIFTADVTSYERSYEGVEKLRALAFDDINECMLQIMTFTVAQIMNKRKLLATDTINCYNDLLASR